MKGKNENDLENQKTQESSTEVEWTCLIMDGHTVLPFCIIPISDSLEN